MHDAIAFRARRLRTASGCLPHLSWCASRIADGVIHRNAAPRRKIELVVINRCGAWPDSSSRGWSCPCPQKRKLRTENTCWKVSTFLRITLATTVWPCMSIPGSCRRGRYRCAPPGRSECAPSVSPRPSVLDVGRAPSIRTLPAAPAKPRTLSPPSKVKPGIRLIISSAVFGRDGGEIGWRVADDPLLGRRRCRLLTGTVWRVLRHRRQGRRGEQDCRQTKSIIVLHERCSRCYGRN